MTSETRYNEDGWANLAKKSKLVGNDWISIMKIFSDLEIVWLSCPAMFCEHLWHSLRVICGTVMNYGAICLAHCLIIVSIYRTEHACL